MNDLLHRHRWFYRPVMPLPRFSLLLLVATAGCAARATTGTGTSKPDTAVAPPPEPLPPPPEVPAVIRVPNVTPEVRYVVSSTAEIQRDSSGQISSLQLETAATVRLALERDSVSTRGSGVVNAFQVTGYEQLGAKARSMYPEPLTVPFDLLFDSLQARVSVRPPLANECDQPETGATALVRELVVHLPREVRAGQTWNESRVSFVCRAGVPMTLRTTNNFRVDNIEMRGATPVVHLTRTTETSMEGSSAGPWRSVSVRGSGTGAQAIRVHGGTGAVLEIDGRNTLVLQVRDEKVTQSTQLRVRSG